MRVLVVEDEPLLAMLTEENLIELGHEVIGPAATVDHALALLQEEGIDAALLDLSLGHGMTSIPVARQLSITGIPFCYLSGHLELNPDDEAPQAPLLTKPVSIGDLQQAIAGMAR